jgi:outer membrane biosynthesis protein TonB
MLPGAAAHAKSLSALELEPYYVRSIQLGRNTMNLRKLGYAALVAATAAVIAIGSAVPSEAKTKKKKAEAAPAPTLCLIVEHHPVCGVKGGTKVTYANGCYAAQDGAKVVSQKACPAGKMAKPHKEKKAKMAPAKKEKTKKEKAKKEPKKEPAKKGAKENNKKT